MKVHPQVINQGNKAIFVILPIDEYKKILSLIEEQQDIEEVKAMLAAPQETFPLEIIEKLSNGESPIKVFREYRGLSQSLLASRVYVSKQYISQIEKFERKGTAKILKAIAGALKVELEELMRNI